MKVHKVFRQLLLMLFSLYHSNHYPKKISLS